MIVRDFRAVAIFKRDVCHLGAVNKRLMRKLQRVQIIRISKQKNPSSFKETQAPSETWGLAGSGTLQALVESYKNIQLFSLTTLARRKLSAFP